MSDAGEPARQDAKPVAMDLLTLGTYRSREVRVLADFSWRGLLWRRSRPARPQPRAPERTTARFDPDKLHPAWRPGVGFELRLGDGPGTPITRDGLRAHITAARLVHGDGEADRLQAELNELMAIKERYDLATSAADARDAREAP